MAISMNIDQEWENFISSSYGDDISSDDEDVNEIVKQTAEEFISANLSSDLTSEAPKSSNIYISTKTKIAYLDTPVDLKELFWQVPVIPYAKPCNGVIKKQMKFNTNTHEELKFIQDNVDDTASNKFTTIEYEKFKRVVDYMAETVYSENKLIEGEE